MGLGPQRKDSKTFGTTVYGLTHPIASVLPQLRPDTSWLTTLQLYSSKQLVLTSHIARICIYISTKVKQD